MSLTTGFVAPVGVAFSLARATASRSVRRVQLRARTSRARTVAVAPASGASAPADAASVDGEAPQRTDVLRVIETPGGYIVDAEVSNFSKTTKHTVIVGKPLLEELGGGAGATPELVVEKVFEYFMEIKQNLTNTLFYFFPDARESLMTRIAEALQSS